jgi:hypothetical protein
MTYNKRNFSIRVAALLVALFFTVGIFLSFAPDMPRYSYWIAMIDVSLMVIITGICGIYNFQLLTKKTTSKLPVAMHISIESTISIFLVASVAIAIIFLLFFNYIYYDLVYLWIVLSKWLLLILVSAAMWSIGQEGQGVIHGRPRDEQMALLNTVQQTLIEFRQLPSSNESNALQRKIDDDLSAIRNQIRSRVSASQMQDDEYELISNLLDEVRGAISEARGSPDSERLAIFMCIQNDVQKLIVTSQLGR